MNNSPNLLLASVSDAVYAALKPHLKTVELQHGAVIGETGGAVKNVYFPHSGIISLVVEMNTGDMIESAMVGRDGAVNAAAALDGKLSLNKSIVQLAGVASVIAVEPIAEVADTFRDFRTLLIRHEQVLFAQSQQSTACNASHLVEARLCRWLLRSRDLAGTDDLLITQEFLAQMLGVRRSSLSIVAGTLQKAGLIRYKRGHVHLVDIQGLKDASCECHEAVRAHYERMLQEH